MFILMIERSIIDIVPPAQADGKATNPEQLFAAGYASCFNGAFDLILKQNKVRDVSSRSNTNSETRR